LLDLAFALLGDRLTDGNIDLVVAREAMRVEQLARLHHTHADVDDLDNEQSLARRRRAVVARAQQPPLDLEAGPLEIAHPPTEVGALPLLADLAVLEQRPPVLEFLDVLEADDSRLDRPLEARPTNDHAGEPAAPVRLLAIAERLAAARLRVERAVGREPGQPHPSTATRLDRIDVPHRFAVVLGIRMVGPVHRDRFGVV